jgi:hypothetical protein
MLRKAVQAPRQWRKDCQINGLTEKVARERAAF